MEKWSLTSLRIQYNYHRDEYCPLWGDVKILGLICNACVLQKKLSNFMQRKKIQPKQLMKTM